MILKAMLTGSRVYGTSRPDSDIDMVLLISEEDLKKITDSGVADYVHPYSANKSASVRFGKMNLICVTDRDMFSKWAEGTIALMIKSPVTREQAIQEFEGKGITRTDYMGEEDIPLPKSKVI